MSSSRESVAPSARGVEKRGKKAYTTLYRVEVCFPQGKYCFSQGKQCRRGSGVAKRVFVDSAAFILHGGLLVVPLIPTDALGKRFAYVIRCAGVNGVGVAKKHKGIGLVYAGMNLEGGCEVRSAEWRDSRWSVFVRRSPH